MEKQIQKHLKKTNNNKKITEKNTINMGGKHRRNDEKTKIKSKE